MSGGARDGPEASGWWSAPVREAGSGDGGSCPHCGRSVAPGQPVRACPECGVVLHAACYEDTEGGRAWATEGCASCFHRTYWR